MWFLPSYARPHALKAIQQAPGGMPTDNLIVVINADDPRRAEYEACSPWPIDYCPAGSRFSDAWHFIWEKYHNEPWFGMYGDDHFAQTPNWHGRLVDAAADRYLSYSNGRDTEFPLMRGTCVLGGKLAHALGGVFPKNPSFKHNYVDCYLDDLVSRIGHMRPLEDVLIDHHHWKFRSSVLRDETYQRGSHDQHDDALKYHNWLSSYDKALMDQKLAEWKASLSLSA